MDKPLLPGTKPKSEFSYHCFPNPNTSFATDSEKPSGATISKFTPNYNNSKTSVLTEQSGSSFKSETVKTAKTKCDFEISSSSSHTKYLKRIPLTIDHYETITKAEYLGDDISLTSTDTFGCILSPDSSIDRADTGAKIKFKKLLKKFDEIPKEIKLDASCQQLAHMTVDVVLDKLLEFFKDKSEPVLRQTRIPELLEAYCDFTKDGFGIQRLDDTILVIDYLFEKLMQVPSFDKYLTTLLKHASKPIKLLKTKDIVIYSCQLRNLFDYFCYLIFCPFEDKFTMIAEAWIFHLSTPDKLRGRDGVKKKYCIDATYPNAYDSLVRGVGVIPSKRFPYFLKLLLIFADYSSECCIHLVKRKALANILCRFNPYFPLKEVKPTDTGPIDPMDTTVKLGDSTKHIHVVLTLLMVILYKINKDLEKNPELRKMLPVPNIYAQRSFIWGYRYECRARHHSKQRNCMTAILMLLVNCYGDKLTEIYNILMPDLVSLAVLTELPPRNDWTGTVVISTPRDHVTFKKYLIQLCVLMIQKEPDSKMAIELRHWLIGLMFILDPNLNDLNPKWSSSHLDELRKLSLQALLCTTRFMKPACVHKCGLVRRLLWYIEWYTVCPYDLSHLYWTIRLLQKAMFQRGTEGRANALSELFSTHGIIIFMNLCDTLLEMQSPPVERCQVVLAMALNIITRAAESQQRVKCSVYPQIIWPISVNYLAKRMLNNVVAYMEQDIYVCDRWLVSLFTFIWAMIVWREEYRNVYISNNNIYKLLDAVVLMRAPLQCLALAVICDLTQSGNAIGQLITWRAKGRGTPAIPNAVKRSANIATLFAAIVQDELSQNEVEFNEDGTIIDTNPIPIMSKTNSEDLEHNPHFLQGKSERTSVCLAASELAGSRISKVYALLAMITEDFARKVNLTDEAYNMYRTAKFTTKEEMTLFLTSHFLTLKLNEAWTENFKECKQALYTDLETIFDFMNMATGWAKNIKHEQKNIIAKEIKRELDMEIDFYSLLKRLSLTNALEALKGIRCIAASSDRKILNRSLIHDAVNVHHKRIKLGRILNEPIIQTFVPFLDSENVLGQNVWINSIFPKLYHMKIPSSTSSDCGSSKGG